MHPILEDMKRNFLKHNIIISWDEEENQFLGFSVKLLQDDLNSSQAQWLGEKLIEIGKKLQKKELEILR